MTLSFDIEEANIILSALSDMDDFFLPKSSRRNDLYILVNKLICAMDLKMKEKWRNANSEFVSRQV